MVQVARVVQKVVGKVQERRILAACKSPTGSSCITLAFTLWVQLAAREHTACVQLDKHLSQALILCHLQPVA